MFYFFFLFFFECFFSSFFSFFSSFSFLFHFFFFFLCFLFSVFFYAFIRFTYILTNLICCTLWWLKRIDGCPLYFSLCFCTLSFDSLTSWPTWSVALFDDQGVPMVARYMSQAWLTHTTKICLFGNLNFQQWRCCMIITLPLIIFNLIVMYFIVD